MRKRQITLSTVYDMATVSLAILIVAGMSVLS